MNDWSSRSRSNNRWGRLPEIILWKPREVVEIGGTIINKRGRKAVGQARLSEMQSIEDRINRWIQRPLEVIESLSDSRWLIDISLVGNDSKASKEDCLPLRREVAIPVGRIIIGSDDNSAGMNLCEGGLDGNK